MAELVMVEKRDELSEGFDLIEAPLQIEENEDDDIVNINGYGSPHVQEEGKDLDGVPHLEVFGDGEPQNVVNNNKDDEESRNAKAAQEMADAEYAKALAMQLAAEEQAKRRKKKQEKMIKDVVKKEIAQGGPLDANDPFWKEKRAQAMAVADNDAEAADLYIKLAPQQPQQQRPKRSRPNARQNAGDGGVFFRDEPHLPELWAPNMDFEHQQIPAHQQAHCGSEAWKQDRAVAMMNAPSDEQASEMYLKMRSDAEGRKKDVKLEQHQIENALNGKPQEDAHLPQPPAVNPDHADEEVDDAKLEQQRQKAAAMANAADDEEAARLYIGMKDLAIGEIRDPVVEQRLAEKQLELKKIWVCRRCTFHNSVSKRKCIACNEVRKDEISQFGNWKCSSCTLDNDASLNVCGACGKHKHAAV